jgi:hypothetical protein
MNPRPRTSFSASSLRNTFLSARIHSRVVSFLLRIPEVLGSDLLPVTYLD